MKKQVSLIDQAKAWSSQIGKDLAYILLINEGLARSTAEKIVFGEYKHEPKQLVTKAITEAIRKSQIKNKPYSSEK